MWPVAAFEASTLFKGVLYDLPPYHLLETSKQAEEAIYAYIVVLSLAL